MKPRLSLLTLVTIATVCISHSGFGQGFTLYPTNIDLDQWFYRDLFMSCNGSNPIPDGFPVTIWWDQDDNGPSPNDIQPPVGTTYGTVNHNQFYVNGESEFGQPGTFYDITGFRSNGNAYLPGLNRFYLKVLATDGTWISNALTAAPGGTPQDLLFLNWICIPFPVYGSCCYGLQYHRLCTTNLQTQCQALGGTWVSNGVCPNLAVSDSVVNIGDVLEGDSGAATLKVYNRGTTSVVVSTASDLPFFTVSPSQFTIQAHDSISVSLRFQNSLPFFHEFMSVMTFTPGGCVPITMNASAAAFPRPNPPAPSVQIPYVSDRRFRIAFDQSANPEPREWAIEITPQNGTTSYLQANDSLGPNIVWASEMEWMSHNGGFVLGLSAQTTYSVRTRVRSLPGSETGTSQIVSITTHAAIVPQAPAKVTIHLVPDTLKFDWSPVGHSVNGDSLMNVYYQLYWSPTVEGPYTSVAMTALTHIDITNYPSETGFFHVQGNSDEIYSPRQNTVISWLRPGEVLSGSIPLIATFPDDYDTATTEIFSVFHDGFWETLPDTAATSAGYDGPGSAMEMMFLIPFPTGPGAVHFERRNSQGVVLDSATSRCTFNQSPVVSAVIAGDTTHRTIHFDASQNYDPDGGYTGVLWDFGDGYHAWGPTAIHTYASPTSTFMATCTVFDSINAETRVTGLTVPANQPLAPVNLAAVSSVCGCSTMVVFYDGRNTPENTNFPPNFQIPDHPQATGPNNTIRYPVSDHPIPPGGHRIMMNFFVHSVLKLGSDPSSCSHFQFCDGTWTTTPPSGSPVYHYKDWKDEHGHIHFYPYPGELGDDDYTNDDVYADNKKGLMLYTLEAKDSKGRATPATIDWLDNPGESMEFATAADVEKYGREYDARFEANVRGSNGSCNCTWQVHYNIGPNGHVNTAPYITPPNCTHTP